MLEKACTSKKKRMERKFKTGNSCWLSEKVSETFCFVKERTPGFHGAMIPLTNVPVKCDNYGDDFHSQRALISKKMRPDYRNT